MSATNTTPNIGLPSFIGTDKPAWLTDWNGAMSTIDSEVGTLKTDLTGDEARIGGLENSVTSLNTTVGQHSTSISNLNTQVTSQGGSINTITSLIGNGTPTTTDQTIIGAINEINAKVTSNSGEYAVTGFDSIDLDMSGLTTLSDLSTAILAAINTKIGSLAAGEAFEILYIVASEDYVNAYPGVLLDSDSGTFTNFFGSGTRPGGTGKIHIAACKFGSDLRLHTLVVGGSSDITFTAHAGTDTLSSLNITSCSIGIKAYKKLV